MKFSDKFIRSQLEIARPLAHSTSLDTARSLQERAGRVMQFLTRRDVVRTNEDFGGVPGALIIPKDEVRSGVILYLHGGGYVSGGLEYAAGFASVLSAECGMRVVTCEYKLAPEYTYPCQINEVFSVYKQLLDSGYSADSIILAGESAGAALTFVTAMKIRDAGLPMPAGIIAISPWCDLTHSGTSHEANRDKDPSLTKEILEFYVKCYVGASGGKDPGKSRHITLTSEQEMLRRDPMVSPVFADLTGLPQTLIFAGGDEILLSDAEKMQERLGECGVQSRLVVREEMWHAYHLYRLKSSAEDFAIINKFIKSVLPRNSERKLRWMGLDNAAKIYPAARTASWTNVFRLSATLKEDVDKRILQSALDVTVRRFPSIAVRVRRGAFWYYLEEIAHAPQVIDEKSYPLVRMPFDDIRACAFRVIVYKKRIAVEFFHALTDGNGGLVFLKSLVAEYLTQKYGVNIPATFGVLDRLEVPSEDELLDCFPKHAGKVAATRRDSDSYRIYGTSEPDRYSNVTTFMIKSADLLELAHKHNVTVTAALTAALIKASIGLQNEDEPILKLQKPVKVLVPCDLRRMYNERTLRNFALYATPGVDPRFGEYTFGEICDIVYKQMKLEMTPKIMSARIKTNVKDEENMLLKLTPLFLKNIVMKAVFEMVGEKKSMFSFSNLGVVKLPEVMYEFIDRMDFVLSVQSRAPYNVSALSYGDVTYMSIIRNIKEPRLEMALYKTLREEGIAVKVESNQR